MSFMSEIYGPDIQSEIEQFDSNFYQDLLADETLAIDDLTEFKYQPVKTPNQTIPSNEEYNGPLDFDVSIIPTGTKNPWVFSPALNKVYIDMKLPFPVDFNVKNRPDHPLFIRITPMYSSPQFAQENVYRCPNHEFAAGTDESMKMRPHIIKCYNPQTEYIGEKANNERLCLLIPFSLPQTGTETVRERFQFMCKNSCPMPGMNRRPVEIIFTLEDEQGNILGRKPLNVRICSCPKRDKEKDESDNAGKPPPGKKRKVEKSGKKVTVPTNDTQETTITIPVVGKHNIEQILKYCQDLFSGEVLRHGNGAEAGPYKEVLNKITAMRRGQTDS